MPNFISIRIFERFKETLNFIINSFQIKHCSFKKMAEYRRNLRGIYYLAKNGLARRNFGPERPGPAQLKFGLDRPGQVHLNLRTGTALPGPAQFVKPEIYNPGPKLRFMIDRQAFSKHDYPVMSEVEECCY